MTTEPHNSTDDDAKVVATSSSPSSSTELTLDLKEDAVESRLIGALVGIGWNQYDARIDPEERPSGNSAGDNTAVLGQITSIELRNRWHEDQTFKNIVKTRGELPAITRLQDTRTATMKVGGCFVRKGDGYNHADLGSVPDTGVQARLVRQEFLETVLASCSKDLFYLGQDYAGNIDFPMWFKHFGSGDGGVGEAYHTGIFGKTGSGKTGLAKMLLAAYARHPEMGILVIDPQGEFTLAMHDREAGSQNLGIKDLLERKVGRRVLPLDISNVQLDDRDLFEELLTESPIFPQVLGIRGAVNIETAADRAMLWVKRNELSDLDSTSKWRDFLCDINSAATDIYKGGYAAQELERKISEILNDDTQGSLYKRNWKPIASLFAEKRHGRSASGIVDELTAQGASPKPIIILNLQGVSRNAQMSEAIQRRIISHIANAIVEGSATSLGSSDTANTLVVLDEAHRFAPSGRSEEIPEEVRLLRAELKRAVRETRKYGVGWMFISQTMMGLDTELLMQLRTMFFGYGLAFGLEFQRLRELAGGDDDAMELYRSFRDPQSAMDAGSKRFPFMAIGPISPMPFSGQPMFFSAFNGKDFMQANRDAFERAALSSRNNPGAEPRTATNASNGGGRTARPTDATARRQRARPATERERGQRVRGRNGRRSSQTRRDESGG